jgi:hypothetical protein
MSAMALSSAGSSAGASHACCTLGGTPRDRKNSTRYIAAVITSVLASRVSSRPAYLPTMNAERRIGLAKSGYTLRRSTSFDTRLMPTKIAMNRPKSDVAESPRSLMILTSCPAVSWPMRIEAPTSSTAKKTRL